MGVKTDLLFPISQQQEIFEGLDDGVRELEFHALDSLQGHDSFLVEMDAFRPVIGRFFKTFNDGSS